MRKIIRLTESDLTRLVRRVINEQTETSTKFYNELSKKGYKMTKDWVKSTSLDDELYGEIKEALKYFNYNGNVMYFTKDVDPSKTIRFITDGKSVYFLKGSLGNGVPKSLIKQGTYPNDYQKDITGETVHCLMGPGNNLLKHL
jgi:hypothetical protein